MANTSFIFIGLVLVWLFVLVPMVVSRRPRVRRTTDVALATRVLDRSGLRKLHRGPGAGHRSDPDWEPEPWLGRDDEAEEMMSEHAGLVDELDDEQYSGAERSVPAAAVRDDFVPDRRGRGGYDPEADSLATAARYRFRQRVVLALIAAIVITAIAAIVLSTKLWLGFGAAALGLAAYLFYLRQQVRIEQEIRRNRLERLQRRGDYLDPAEVPDHLRRPGAVVLEADDEDPVFDHLEHADASAIGYDDAYEDERYRHAAG